MKDFLENLIKNIVDNPDDVKIEESQDETGQTTLLISVNDSDMGRVIGKSGKVINAIRTIARIMAIRQGVRVRVDVKDSRPKQAEMPVPQSAEEPQLQDQPPVEEQPDTTTIEPPEEPPVEVEAEAAPAQPEATKPESKV